MSVEADALRDLTPPPPPRGRQRPGVDNLELHRRRILAGVVRAMARDGFVECSVTDIAHEAGLSRRTFYDVFDGKESAFLAAYSAANALMRSEVERALATSTVWHERLLRGTAAFVRTLTDHREASIVFLRESWRAGTSAWHLRDWVLDSWADLLVTEVTAAWESDPGSRVLIGRLDHALALGVIHGMKGLMLGQILAGADPADSLRCCVTLLAGASYSGVQGLGRLAAESPTASLDGLLAHAVDRRTAGPR